MTYGGKMEDKYKKALQQIWNLPAADYYTGVYINYYAMVCDILKIVEKALRDEQIHNTKNDKAVD